MDLPTIDHYARGNHAHVFRSDRLTVWFSYSTPVAFQLNDGQIVVRDNEWGRQTGRHLAFIGRYDEPNQIVSGEKFERCLAKACKGRRAGR